MRRRDLIGGLTLYAAGDTVATLILGTFQWTRMLGIMFVGATLYAWEIPTYFRWLDSCGFRPLARGLLAAAYFNPLWIARHLFFIRLFSGAPFSWDIFPLALTAFIYAVPFTVVINILIQGVIPLSWRFIASASFSMAMAIYYALSTVLFR